MKNSTGVIIVAHGSKCSESNEEFIKLCEKVKLENIFEFDLIKYAFLEFEKPTMEMVLRNMSDKKIQKVYVYPYFLNSGKHVSVDIPKIVSTLEVKYPSMDIELLEHFGSSQSVVSIISSDLQTAL